LKQEDMKSQVTESKFMAQVLNSLNINYELQIVLIQKRIRNKENPLRIDELQVELIFRYERLSLVSEATSDIDLTEEKACLRLTRRQIVRIDVNISKGLRFNQSETAAGILGILMMNVSSY
jgi:hypothetical protein